MLALYLKVGWVLCTGTAMALFFASDAFQHYAAFPLHLVLFFAAVAQAVASALAVGYGVATVPQFKPFMPFRGGNRFVTLQALGFSAVSGAIALPIGYVLAVIPAVGQVRGLLSATALLAGAGDMLVMQSVGVFDVSRVAPKVSFASVSRNAGGDVLLVFVLCGSMLIVATLAHFFAGLETVASLIIIGMHVSCGLLAHVVVGYRKTKGYRLFAPMQGSRRTRIARASAWALWSIAALAAAAHTAEPRGLKYSFLGVALVCAAANLGLLAQISIAASKSPESTSAAGKDGRFVLTGSAILAYLAVLAAWTLQESPAAAAASTVGVVLGVALFAVPPLTHGTGRLLYKRRFDLFHPFLHQGRAFVTWQALGWSAYTVALLVATVELRHGIALVTSTMLILAQVAIHGSIKAFCPKRNAPAKSHATPFVRNELFVAAALSALSLVLRVIADHMTTASDDFPVPTVVGASSLLWGVAVPLAHLARPDRTRALFRPFAGTVEYVALQAVGWSFFAVCALVCIVLHVELATQYDAFRTQSALFHYPLTVQGVMMQIPFGLVAASLFFDRDAPSDEPGRVLLSLCEDLAKRDGSADKVAACIASEAVKIAGPSAASSRKKMEEVLRLLRELGTDLRAEATAAALEASAAAAGDSGESPSRQHGVGAAGDDASGSETHGAIAKILVGCMAAACIVLGVGADYVKTYSAAQAAVLSFLCIGVSAATSTAVHLGYGPIAHPNVYRRWMPFRGGVPFVVWQMCAGSAFSVGIILFAHSAFSLFDEATAASLVGPSALLVAGVCCAVAPVLTLFSIAHFDAAAVTDAEEELTFFERHAEGIVSMLVFAFAWAMTSAVDLAHVSTNWTLVAPALLVATLSFAVAVPLAVVALRKAAAATAQQRQIACEDAAVDVSDEGDGPSTLPVLQAASGLVIILVPVLGIFALHFAWHSAPEYATTVQSVITKLLLVLLAVMGVSLALHLDISNAHPRLRDAVATSISFTMYGALFTQSYVLLLSLYLPEYPCGVVFMNVLLLMGPRITRQICNFVNVAFLGLQLAAAAVGRVGPGEAAASVAVAGGFILYHTTYNDHDPVQATRYSTRVVTWARQTWLWALEHYFQVEVISEADHPLCGPDDHGGVQAVYGYHPHGVFPLTAVWMQHTNSWLRSLGTARRVTVHAASIIFTLPFVRDIALSFGSCEVTRRAIEFSLKDGRSPLVVPGGQAEMLYTKMSRTKVVLTGYHKGFIKIAVKHRVPLVPVFCFGEQNIMDNVHLHKVQRYFLKRFGFGYPVVAIGRWGLPLPCPERLTFVIGKPIDPFKIAPQLATLEDGAAAWNAAIDVVTHRYFDEVCAMVERHKVRAGFPDLKVVVQHERPR